MNLKGVQDQTSERFLAFQHYSLQCLCGPGSLSNLLHSAECKWLALYFPFISDGKGWTEYLVPQLQLKLHADSAGQIVWLTTVLLQPISDDSPATHQPLTAVLLQPTSSAVKRNQRRWPHSSCRLDSV